MSRDFYPGVIARGLMFRHLFRWTVAGENITDRR